MGKAEIISGGTDGRYTVKLILHREHIQEKIADLTAQIDAWTVKIDEMEAGPAKDRAIFQRNVIVKRKEYLENNTPEDPTVDAWCADLTEDLTGSVGTIEIPGERGSVNIQPGYSGNAVYTQDRDGQLQPAIAAKSAAGVFYNLALLPGWQKWFPTFRSGIIKSIDSENDTVCVELDRIKSSQQDFDINYFDILSNILVEYMSCNSAAFDVGDHVIVKFTSITTQAEENWATAKVIGFVDNPKACNFSFKLTRGDGTLITQSSGLFSGFTVTDFEGNSVSISSASYDPVTEYWSFNVTDEFDTRGYFISYRCTNGISTQYPYRYKVADKGNLADLIKPRAYTDTIPYWKVETTVTGGWSTVEARGGEYSIKKKVYSSVPYNVTHFVQGAANRIPYIVYKKNPSAPAPHGVDEFGNRCCFAAGSFNYFADTNPIDSGAEQIVDPVYYDADGGFADSMIVFQITSSKIDHTEVYPPSGAIDLEEIEAGTPDYVTGTEHEIILSNDTPAEADSRTMLCNGGCTGPFYTSDPSVLAYEEAHMQNGDSEFIFGVGVSYNI